LGRLTDAGRRSIWLEERRLGHGNRRRGRNRSGKSESGESMNEGAGDVKLSELLKKREQLEAQSVERQLADVNARIAQAEADEAAKQASAQAEAHRAALADARAKRDDAQGRALGALALCAGALDDMQAAEGALRDLGVFLPYTESIIRPATRAEVRRALQRVADMEAEAAKAAALAAIPPEERRRRELRSNLDWAEHCLDVAQKSGREDVERNLRATIRELRRQLGDKAPADEPRGTPSPDAVHDAALLAQVEGWREHRRSLEAKEADA